MTLDSLLLGSMAPMAPMAAVLEAEEVTYSNPRQLDVKYVCQPQCYDSCHPCVTLDSLHLRPATTTKTAAAAASATPPPTTTTAPTTTAAATATAASFNQK